MTEDNSDTWAYTPGHSKANILRDYYMFNLTNPDDVRLNGAIPTLTSVGAYEYLEHDDFLERRYTHYDGSDTGQVEFKRHQWFNKFGEWDKGLSEDDLITNINLGSLVAWYQLKHLPTPTVALVGLSTLIQGLDSLLPALSYAQGVKKILPSYSLTNIVVFSSAGLTKNETLQLYYDQSYGFEHWETLQYWVQAVLQAGTSQDYVYTPGLGGAQHILQSYFGYSDTQMAALLSGLQSAVVAGADVISRTIGCGTDVVYCAPDYMTRTQWVDCGVSRAGGLASVAGSNITIQGYPEMSYFIANNYANNTPQYNVTFTIQEAYALLDYNLTTGWPSGSPYTLLDAQHMLDFYILGSMKDWASIQAKFNLSSTLKAEVLFDYMNTLVAITGLQGRTDPDVYNIDNRGLTSEVSMGTLISQVLVTLYYQLGDLLAITLTSAFMFAQYVMGAGLSCGTVVTNAGLNPNQVCTTSLNWTSPTNLIPWIEARWGGVNSTQWYEFQAASGLSYTQMTTLFNSAMLNMTLEGSDLGLQDHYQCGASVNGTIGYRCFPYELWYRQWGASEITLNLPPQILALGLKDAPSVVYLNPEVIEMIGGIPEYYAYALTQNSSAAPLSKELSRSLLSFDALMSQVQAQSYFIDIFLGQEANITKNFGITDVPTMTGYLRYISDQIALGGLFITETVDWWLWTGTSPFVQKIAEQNPLFGGNPAQDPTSIQLGQNVTIERLNAYPDQYKSAMSTGRNNIGTKLRCWTKFMGTNVEAVLTRVYKGHSPDGPIITWEYVEPWAKTEYIQGTDGLSFPPFIDDDTDIYLYVDNFYRSGKASYTNHKHIHDFKAYGFTLSPDLIANSTTNPENAAYYSFGPDGLINLTSAIGGPVFASLSYFYDGDQRLRNVLNFTEPYDLDDYQTKFYLMHYAGIVMDVQEQLMTNVELKSDVLYPNLGATGYAKEGIWTYMPIFNLNRKAKWSNSRLDLIFGPIKDAQTTAEVLYYLFFGLFGLMMGIVLAVVGIIIYKKRKARMSESSDQSEARYREMVGS
mmetsp:Transcript_362/g.423  ORF Transcript_362/g.423 Transcript_362/m.423 type:complete len:1033 (-) Transcript_362:1443-4541(-)